MQVEPKPCVYDTVSSEETFRLGRRIGEKLRPGDTVALSGDLGSGKTCLIQGICNGLNVPTPATSPTFTLINEYAGRLRVAHFDLYRLDDPKEVLDLGFDEYVESDRVCLIEWADKFPELMPRTRIDIRIETGEGDFRRIYVTILRESGGETGGDAAV